MTPALLALNLGLSFAALTALCLCLDRHHAEVFGRRAGRARRIGLRFAGWAGLALSLCVAGLGEGWGFGTVQWIGAVTGAGLALVLLLSYRPGWVRPAAIVLLSAGLLAVLT